MRHCLLSILLALLCQHAAADTVRAVTEETAFAWPSNGRVAGPATAVVERTLQTAGLDDYRLELYPWARAYDLALHEPNVLIYLIARTAEREAQFQWVGEVLRLRYYFYRLASRDDVRIDGLDDARGYSVGVLRDDVRAQYLQRLGFQRLVVSGQSKDNFNRLLTGQIDTVVLAEVDAKRLCQANCPGLTRLAVLDGLETPLYMAFSQGTQAAAVQRAREAFAALTASGEVTQLLARP